MRHKMVYVAKNPMVREENWSGVEGLSDEFISGERRIDLKPGMVDLPGFDHPYYPSTTILIKSRVFFLKTFPKPFPAFSKAY